jgi:NADPH-dependent glutamate synthase beta subunit-like oxidoreductase/NAD-dependent dihydropyrimidine dehydrogenase PreA subunit
MKEEQNLRESETVGAVLVVGGGIGGIQASLDLANSGYRVYLVEETSAIGGRMAQLDKTFPTNDCSMCTISPKLIEVDKHLNIDIITNAELDSIEGEPGQFKVKILKRPRFIDLEKCNACGDCLEVCPVQVPSEFDESLMPRKAIYKRYPQAVPNVVAITKADRAPCGLTCPAGINVQGYVALIAAGKFREAYQLILERNPLPSICGRVCHHPCELQCNRKELDESVSINRLKRFVSDYVRSHGGYKRFISDYVESRGDYGEEADERRPTIDPQKPRVAVVGAGPAGLTAAHDLALLGYPTTIFEALPVVGGMMYTGIPEYRFPKSLIQHDAQAIFELGVELKTNTSVGKDIPLAALRDEGYRATFLAVGAHKGLRMEIPGEDLKGVQLGVPFLREHNLGNRVEVGKHMTVVGGGNVAVDAARCCLRLGVETVKILYRRTREEMPAIEEEIEAALEEGVEIEYLCAPVEILGEGGSVRGIRCIRMQSGEPDASGRRRPVPIPGSEHDVSCDGVIVAIGQAWDPSFLGEDPGLEVVKGILKADRVTLETNLPGVFAGGDAATGPRSVVEAIGEGHEAAISIDRYLRGQDLREGRPRPKGEPSPFPEGRSFEVTPRQPAEKIPADESRGSWKEVEITFTEQQAVEEAKRCLNCGICCECFECVKACQADAVDHEM